MNLTDETIRSLACPEGKSDKTFWDEDLKGFGLRVRPGGVQTWIVQYELHGRSRKMSFGSPTVIPAALARAKAKSVIAAKLLGGDPVADKMHDRAKAANARLTDKNIHGLICPAGVNEKTFWDSDLPGFGLRVRAGGAKTWIVQYELHGRSRKMSFGSPAIVPAADARAKAKDIMAARQLGGDPVADKARSRTEAGKTIASLLPRYLAWKTPRLRPRTLAQTRRHLMLHLAPLHREPVAAVTRAMIAQRLGELSASNGSGASTWARSSWSSFFHWVACEGLIESNPVAYTNRPREATVRDHAVSDTELAAIWRALDDESINANYAAILRLLILTGARRDEIASLQRDEVDLDAKALFLPAARIKNKRDHVVPLSPPAVAILQAQLQRRSAGRELVFGYSHFSKSKKALDGLLGAAVAPWVVHDFRRSISTALHERFNVPPHIVETILGHVGGHKGGVAGVYNKALYLDQRRDALERWGEHVMQLTGGNVVRIETAILASREQKLASGADR